MNVQNYTVNQARSIIRFAQDQNKVLPFLKHSNHNVVRSAKFALKFKLGGAVQAIPSDPEVEALAAKYETSVEEVQNLVTEKGSLAGAKRSLAAKKSAKTRAAKTSD